MSEHLDPPPGDPTDSFPQRRQTARLEEVPELYRRQHERLAIELALDIDDAQAIFDKYGYDASAAVDLMEQPAFQLLLAGAQKMVVEEGVGFRTKAKLLANEALPYAHEIITDPLQSAAVRADLVKWLAKIADYEPKNAKDDAPTGGLTLSITFAGQPPQQVVAGTVQHQPLTIDQET